MIFDVNLNRFRLIKVDIFRAIRSSNKRGVNILILETVPRHFSDDGDEFFGKEKHTFVARFKLYFLTYEPIF